MQFLCLKKVKQNMPPKEKRSGGTPDWLSIIITYTNSMKQLHRGGGSLKINKGTHREKKSPKSY